MFTDHDPSLSPENNRENLRETEMIKLKEVQLDNNRFRPILTTHNPDPYASGAVEAVAAALQDCDVIGIESVGGDQETRHEYEQAFTQLLAKQTVEVESHREMIAMGLRLEHYNERNFSAGLWRELLGTDKVVTLLDMNSDDPHFSLFKESLSLDDEYEESVADLKLAAARDILRKNITEVNRDAIRARDAVIAGQITQLSHTLDNKTVGIVLGALHYGALAPLYGDQADAKLSDIARAVEPLTGLRLKNELEFRYMTTGHYDEPLADRVLLSMIAARQWTTAPLYADPVIREISDEEVTSLLSQIEAVANKPMRTIYIGNILKRLEAKLVRPTIKTDF